jgi:hypothetical protein
LIPDGEVKIFEGEDERDWTDGTGVGNVELINTRKAMKDDSIAILFYEVISNFRMN